MAQRRCSFLCLALRSQPLSGSTEVSRHTKGPEMSKQSATQKLAAYLTALPNWRQNVTTE